MKKSLKFKTRSLKSEQGFTLIELIVVIVVISVVGSVIGAIIISAVRTTTKINILTSVKQNGNYAMTQMSKMIRYAKSFDGVSNDNISYTTDCTQPVVLPLTPTPTRAQYKYIKITSFDNGQTVFSCNPVNGLIPATIASNSVSLIDTQNSVAIDYNSCFFTCQQTNLTDVPIVGMQFRISQKKESSLVEHKVSLDFQTGVSIRNQNR